MDCSATESGWFELKAYITQSSGSGTWENDVTQSSQCTGDVGGSRPFESGSHFARCGFVNVVEFQQAACTINSLGQLHLFAFTLTSVIIILFAYWRRTAGVPV